MTSIISVFNQCGGVAKTTLTHNLGYHLSLSQRVLLIDFDPQSSLTVFVGLNLKEIKETSYQILSGKQENPLSSIKTLSNNFDVLPSNIQLSEIEVQLAGKIGREQRLKKALAPLKDKYDFILIDCPPSLGLLSVLALTASTHILVPIQTHSKSFEGTDLLLKTVREVHDCVNPSLSFAGFVPTLYDKRTIHHYEVLKAIKEQLPVLGKVFEPIPNSISFPDSSLKRLPLALHDPKHRAIPLLSNVADSLISL